MWQNNVENNTEGTKNGNNINYMYIFNAWARPQMCSLRFASIFININTETGELV